MEDRASPGLGLGRQTDTFGRFLCGPPLLLVGFKLELGGEEEEAAAALAREEVVAPGRQQDTTRCPAIWMGGAQGRCRSRGEGREKAKLGVGHPKKMAFAITH